MKFLGETAMDLFKQSFYEKIKDSLRSEILLAFESDRNGNDSDLSLLKKIVNCYVHMGYAAPKPMKSVEGFYWAGSVNLSFYDTEFEAPFLSASKELYDKKAAVWISRCSAPEYLDLADKAFTHEENYCHTMLQPETKPKLMKRVEQELVTNRSKQIVEQQTGCMHMIK